MPSDAVHIQAYLRQQARRSRMTQALAAFTIYAPASAGDADGYYAIPRRMTRPVRDADLEELRTAFQMQSAQPRIEFLAGLFPDLPERLASTGYLEAQRQPVLIAHEVHSPPAQAHMEFLVITQESSLEDVRENLDTNALGFGEAAGASDQEAQAFRAGLVTSRAFTLRVAGQPVAAGMFEAIRSGVTELMGITTLPEYRRQGFAGYLTAAMAERAFAHGATLVFLCAASAEAGRVYERAGFRPCSALVEYTRGANGEMNSVAPSR